MSRSILAFLMLILFSATAQSAKESEKDKNRIPKPDLKAIGETLKRIRKDGELSDGQSKEAYKLLSFYTALDQNGDGILQPEEYAKNRSRSTIEKRIRETGMDPSRPLLLTTFMSKRLWNAGIKSDKVRNSVVHFVKPRVVTKRTRERVTVELQVKFVELDRNGDQQIGLYEWPREKYREFFQLDRNNDGLLTPREIEYSQQNPTTTQK